MATPSILFVCVHNAGRSQIAAAYARSFSHGLVEVRSAGAAPVETLNPVVVLALAEDGIDIMNERPKLLTPDVLALSDAVITMDCEDSCPVVPGKRYEEWHLGDPAGQSVENVRRIRDEIKGRVQHLVEDLIA